jgi:predicted DNA-binding transcriptional regulator
MLQESGMKVMGAPSSSSSSSPSSSSSGENDRDRIEYELRGKTLKVYLFVLRQRKPVGVREVQRELGFSSPSVAYHHIEKLTRLGIVEQDGLGNYVLSKKVDPGILQAFVNVGRFSLPRLGFYAVFFSTVATAYLVVDFNYLDLYAVVGTVGAAGAFWFEAVRLWRRRPF